MAHDATVLFAKTPVSMPYTMPNHSAIVPTRDTRGNLDQMDMPAGARSAFAVERVRAAAEIVDGFADGVFELGDLELGDDNDD